MASMWTRWKVPRNWNQRGWEVGGIGGGGQGLGRKPEPSEKVNMLGREEIQCFPLNFLHTTSGLKLGFIKEPTDMLPEVYLLNYTL